MKNRTNDVVAYGLVIKSGDDLIRSAVYSASEPAFQDQTTLEIARVLWADLPDEAKEAEIDELGLFSYVFDMGEAKLNARLAEFSTEELEYSN